jgi:DNA-binding GntR family transcriptional regulator
MDTTLTTQLEMLILTGKLKPRERLVETEIASKLNTSRFLVRNAMQELVRKGLIEMIPNRGARVIDLSDEEVEDAFLIRLNLEFLVAELAVKRMTPEKLRGMREIQRDYVKAVREGSVEEMILTNERFHNALYHATGNRLIQEIIGQVRNTTFFLRYNGYFIPGRTEQSVADHEAILTALKQHDLKNLKRVITKSVLFPKQIYLSRTTGSETYGRKEGKKR